MAASRGHRVAVIVIAWAFVSWCEAIGGQATGPEVNLPTGCLRVQSDPIRCTVFFQGRQIEKEQPLLELAAVPIGRHPIAMQVDGTTLRGNVEIGLNQVLDIRADFVHHKAIVNLTALRKRLPALLEVAPGDAIGDEELSRIGGNPGLDQSLYGVSLNDDQSSSQLVTSREPLSIEVPAGPVKVTLWYRLRMNPPGHRGDGTDRLESRTRACDRETVEDLYLDLEPGTKYRLMLTHRLGQLSPIEAVEGYADSSGRVLSRNSVTDMYEASVECSFMVERRGETPGFLTPESYGGPIEEFILR